MLYKVSPQSDFKSPNKQPVKLEDNSSELESKEALPEHIKNEANMEIDEEEKSEPGNSRTSCDICHRCFNSMTVAIQHRFRVHPNAQTKFNCKRCGISLPLKKNWDENVVNDAAEGTNDSSDSVSVIDCIKCDKCNAVEAKNKSIKSAKKSPSKQPVKTEHKCVLCSAKLDSKEALQEHFRKHANKEIDYPRKKTSPVSKTKTASNAAAKCDICNEYFDSIAVAIQHRFKMHPTIQTKFSCNYCGMVFPLKANWDAHVVKHDAAESLDTLNHKKCDKCDVVFYNSKAWTYHNKSVHRSSSKQPAKQEHKCVLCSAKLESKEALQEHFRKHANKQIDDVGKSNPTKSRKASNVEAKCDICNKSFDSTTLAIRHRFKMHPTAQTKFYCNYCGMSFPLKVNWDAHVAKHNSAESANVEYHKKCDDCDVVFYNLKAWTYHNRSVHRRLVHLFQPVATPPPSNKIKVNSMNDALSVYYCHLCGAEYIVKFNLQQHLEKVHSRQERDAMPNDLIKCTMCAAFFYNKKAYDVHNGYHTSSDLYVTSEEQRLQTVTKVDQDFDIRRVKPRVEKYIPKTTIRKFPCRVQIRKPNKDTETLPKFEEVMIDESKMIKTERVSSASESQNDFSSDSESDIPLEKRLKLS